MREKRDFAKRSLVLQSNEAKKKYFLVYEGSKTEEIYFDAVNRLRDEVGINPLIELVPVIRDFSEEGWSNPKKILDRLIQNIQYIDHECISYEFLLNCIIDYLYSDLLMPKVKIAKSVMWSFLRKICKEELAAELDDVVQVDDIEKVGKCIFTKLKSKYHIAEIIDDINEIISYGKLKYEAGFDKICLIVDRDRESFLSIPGNNQYDYVVSKCREKGFMLCVTNPCFEFWLLLHYEEVFSLSREALVENAKKSNKRRYAEHCLREICPKFNKNSYPAEELVRRIDIAIENEKQFCEDVVELERSVGSNIGILLESMRKA